MTTAIVYSAAGCQPCRLTKLRCEAAGYKVIDCPVDQEDKRRNWRIEYETHFPDSRSLPGVCVYDDDDQQIAKWTGMRPDLIEQHRG